MRLYFKRAFLLLMTLAFLPFFVGAQAAVSLDEAVQRGVAYLQGRFPRGTRAIVLPGQSETPEVAEYVNAKLGAVLVNGGWFVMVVGDDAAQESISREMERHLNFEVSQETELSIGKQLGAQIIISNTLNRAGQGWRLDIEAVWIESAQREGQWSAENIRTDPAWASLASVRSAGLSFVGNALAAREMQAIADGLRSGMQTYNTGLDLDERSPGRAGYGFTVTLYKEQLPPAPPANTALLRAEATIEFSNNGRVLYKTGPYYITETTDALIARRVAERLRDDQAFFSRVNEAVK